MSEADFSKPSSSTTSTALVAPASSFNAFMVRDGAIGALISIAVGFGLLFVQLAAFPDVNLNSWMITAIGKLAGEDVGMYIGAVLNIPTTTSQESPFYFLQFFYAAFLSFPSNLGWMVGGLFVGLNRVKSGRDEGNLKAGWDTFWYAMLSIEIPFAVFLAIFLISSVVPTAAAALVAAFAGSLLLYFLLFFLMPMFWLGLIFALLGSMFGSMIARRK